MTICEIAKALKSGEKIDGWTLQGTVLSNGSRWWTVHGDHRCHCDEIPDPSTIPLVEKTERPKMPRFIRKICKDCGQEFIISKYHAKRERCTECDRKFRQEVGEDRAKVCLRCGVTFFISKYKPYADPQYCPRCGAILRAREHRRKSKITIDHP